MNFTQAKEKLLLAMLGIISTLVVGGYMEQRTANEKILQKLEEVSAHDLVKAEQITQIRADLVDLKARISHMEQVFIKPEETRIKYTLK